MLSSVSMVLTDHFERDTDYGCPCRVDDRQRLYGYRNIEKAVLASAKIDGNALAVVGKFLQVWHITVQAVADVHVALALKPFSEFVHDHNPSPIENAIRKSSICPNETAPTM